MVHRLRWKLFAFMLLVSFVPMLLVGVLGYTAQKEELQAQAEETLVHQNERLTDELARHLEERFQDAEYLAQNPVIRDPLTLEAQYKSELSRFLDVHPMYRDVFVINTNGIIIADIHSRLRSQDVRDRPWFDDVLEGEGSISSVYRSPLLQEPVMVMAVPVFDNSGSFKRILLPAFDMEQFHEEMTAFMEMDDNAWEASSFLLNEDGDIITHRDPDQILDENFLQESGVTQQQLEASSENGTIVHREDGQVLAFSRIPSFSGFDQTWYVGVEAGESAFSEPLSNLLRQYLVLFGIVLIALFAAVLWLSRRLEHPVAQLVDKAGIVERGGTYEKEFRGSYREIDDLNRAFDAMAEKLSAREQFHRRSTLVLESTDNGVFAFERESGRITLWNRRCREMFQQQAPRTIGDLAQRSSAFADIKPYLTFTREPLSRELQLEEDGVQRHFLISMAPLEQTGEDEWLVLFFDLTDKRRVEREMIRSERLKVVAQMAAGFAHEVRNPLTTIRGFIQLAHQNNAPISREYYELVIGEIDRVNKIIKELLKTADPDPEVEEGKVDLHQVVRDVVTLQESQLRAHQVSWRVQLDDSDAFVWADKNKLKQVLVNLVQNSMEAMTDGGTMTITTLTAENGSVITIQDTGIGMDEKTIERLGTPFFTNKETGTGLGLTMSYRLIQEMNGSVDVDSAPGQGTTFTIYLPHYRETG
ncbi:sensor histidine kinase [Alkalicoccus urumqiensis]|uniref:histidine kinase n=1 Tax=Alkalicoccus urumqiensis TaxID=1548213 RepID=A0A2P6MDB4_ALKUR|nr:PAS domain-containing sensor histidine kinase [Alkalicoccus urumqiensis]PRO64262.1 hypothetical protein C6I21_15760 [Alkalicoccus urumqiensis]